MALLLDRRSLGRADSIIAPDLSDKMNSVRADQKYADDDGTFDLRHTRLWVDEYSTLAARGAEVRDVSTEDRTIESPWGRIVTRHYNPGDEALTLVFVHGGGWVIGGIASHDHIARWLAAETGGQVVQIEYSLAPEHPYPTAVNQVAAVIASILKASPRSPVLIAGDSAGANIAATSILRLSSEQRRQIAGFVSIYGAYAPEMNLSSHKLYGDGRFGLSEAQMRWFWNLYAPHLLPEERTKQLTPLTADLADFPPTLCIGAECDVLLDDTLAFYGELTKAGVDVSLSLWSGLPHGCMHFVGAVESVTQAATSIVQFVRGHGDRPNRRPAALAIVSGGPAEEKSRSTTLGKASQEALVDVEPLFSTTRSRLHGSLAHRIAADIITGNFAPGSLLPREDSAGESFGVSRSAYREAIRTLAAKGLVSALPKVGTKIAPRAAWHILDPDILAWNFELDPSEEFIRNLFELRKIVEPSAAALASMRCTKEDLSRIADSLSRMARTNPRTGAWLNAIVAFHHGLLSAGRNEALTSLWPAIQTTLRWSVKIQMMLPTLLLGHDPVADHARVFEKLASQNADGALTEMALLIDAALADTLSNMRRVELAHSAKSAT